LTLGLLFPVERDNTGVDKLMDMATKELIDRPPWKWKWLITDKVICRLPPICSASRPTQG